MIELDVLLLDDHVNEQVHHLCCGDEWQANIASIAEFRHQHQSDRARVLLVVYGGDSEVLSLEEILNTNPYLTCYNVRICLFSQSPQKIESALSCFFDDFIFLPCTKDEFKTRVRYLHQYTQGVVLQDPLAFDTFAQLNLRGKSLLFVDTLKLIKRVAKCNASVLIQGESGTGKENAARAIHYLSQRQGQAFVPINCGAIPDNLLEAELFGHEKGAFTDAKRKQEGLISVANQGTLFLDEVDCLSPKAQAALLRFLQTGEYRPLGSNQNRQSQVRIIAATNAELAQLAEVGKFREDLYFRLNVLEVWMPPLRERPEDIKVIAQYLIQKYYAEYGYGPTRIHPASMRWLLQQTWAGNVRELENVLLREFLLADGELLVIGHRNAHGQVSIFVEQALSPSPGNFQAAKEAAIMDFESHYVEDMLAFAAGNVTRAARLAGKERRAFGKLIKKYNIDRSRYVTS